MNKLTRKKSSMSNIGKGGSKQHDKDSKTGKGGKQRSGVNLDANNKKLGSRGSRLLMNKVSGMIEEEDAEEDIKAMLSMAKVDAADNIELEEVEAEDLADTEMVLEDEEDDDEVSLTHVELEDEEDDDEMLANMLKIQVSKEGAKKIETEWKDVEVTWKKIANSRPVRNVESSLKRWGDSKEVKDY